MYNYVKMEKLHNFLFIYNNKHQSYMKTKLTISIDKELLDKFNKHCDLIGLNKSKFVSNLIKKNINKENDTH